MSPKQIDPIAQKKKILPVLVECKGSIQAAAAHLGMPRSTLRYWIDVLKLRDEVLRLKGQALLDSIGPETIC